MPLNSTVRLVHRRGSAVTHATASTLRTEGQGQGYRRLGAQAPFGSLSGKLANRRARVFNRVGISLSATLGSSASRCGSPLYYAAVIVLYRVCTFFNSERGTG